MLGAVASSVAVDVVLSAILLGVTGTDWSWGSSSHAWADDSDDQVKRQARRARLIKDVSLL